MKYLAVTKYLFFSDYTEYRREILPDGGLGPIVVTKHFNKQMNKSDATKKTKATPKKLTSSSSGEIEL